MDYPKAIVYSVGMICTTIALVVVDVDTLIGVGMLGFGGVIVYGFFRALVD